MEQKTRSKFLPWLGENLGPWHLGEADVATRLPRTPPFSCLLRRPSHLRRANFGPSKWPVYPGSVRAICGPPTRQTVNRRRPAVLLYYVNLLKCGRLWPAYLMRHGPFLAHMVFASEKACSYDMQEDTAGQF